MEDGITADLQYSTMTVDWDITEAMQFEAILSTWEQFQRQVIDFDGTEFLVTTDDLSQNRENDTMELHLTGTAWNDRINWIGGYYSLDEELTTRTVRLGYVRVGDPRWTHGQPHDWQFDCAERSTFKPRNTSGRPPCCSA